MESEKRVREFYERPGLIMLAVLGVLGVLLLALSIFTVDEYERGVVTTGGKVSYVASPGYGFKVPFIQSVTKMRTDISVISPSRNERGQAHGVNTYTSDNQEVDIVFTVFYRVPVDKVAFVYENVQDYKARLHSMSNDRLKAEMGRINLAHFAEKRAAIRDTIRATIKQDALVLGLEVTDFQLTDVQYTKSFRDAVEAAASAKAGVETREQEKQQEIRTAEKVKIVAEGKANAAREEAKGAADARLLQATAEAQAIRLQGDATASAMRAQALALAQNPVLVEMKKAEQWDGKLPQQLLSGITPFMQFNQPAAK